MYKMIISNEFEALLKGSERLLGFYSSFSDAIVDTSAGGVSKLSVLGSSTILKPIPTQHVDEDMYVVLLSDEDVLVSNTMYLYVATESNPDDLVLALCISIRALDTHTGVRNTVYINLSGLIVNTIIDRVLTGKIVTSHEHETVPYGDTDSLSLFNDGVSVLDSTSSMKSLKHRVVTAYSSGSRDLPNVNYAQVRSDQVAETVEDAKTRLGLGASDQIIINDGKWAIHGVVDKEVSETLLEYRTATSSTRAVLGTYGSVMTPALPFTKSLETIEEASVRLSTDISNLISAGSKWFVKGEFEFLTITSGVNKGDRVYHQLTKDRYVSKELKLHWNQSTLETLFKANLRLGKTDTVIQDGFIMEGTTKLGSLESEFPVRIEVPYEITNYSPLTAYVNSLLGHRFGVAFKDTSSNRLVETSYISKDYGDDISAQAVDSHNYKVELMSNNLSSTSTVINAGVVGMNKSSDYRYSISDGNVFDGTPFHLNIASYIRYSKLDISDTINSIKPDLYKGKISTFGTQWIKGTYSGKVLGVNEIVGTSLVKVYLGSDVIDHSTNHIYLDKSDVTSLTGINVPSNDELKNITGLFKSEVVGDIDGVRVLTPNSQESIYSDYSKGYLNKYSASVDSYDVKGSVVYNSEMLSPDLASIKETVQDISERIGVAPANIRIFRGYCYLLKEYKTSSMLSVAEFMKLQGLDVDKYKDLQVFNGHYTYRNANGGLESLGEVRYSVGVEYRFIKAFQLRDKKIDSNSAYTYVDEIANTLHHNSPRFTPYNVTTKVSSTTQFDTSGDAFSSNDTDMYGELLTNKNNLYII